MEAVFLGTSLLPRALWVERNLSCKPGLAIIYRERCNALRAVSPAIRDDLCENQRFYARG
jgi:hypothetical protein